MAIAFGANTAAVVVAQVLLQRRLETGRARTNATVFAALWAVTWLMVLLAIGAHSSGVSLVLLIVGVVVFAVGETIFGITVPALVNSCVDDRSRGHANGLYSLAMSLGFFVGPLLAGQLLAETRASVMAQVMLVGCLAVAVFAFATGSRQRLSGLGRGDHG
ncbi:major facilitator superfamily protein [mine drainage metagenome]|uniref:Major facilitator superfamily protein n=1 Tax=mine drainage metagenome TaxID=410659 RepID=A0A1J5QBC6_9ZZZZ